LGPAFKWFDSRTEVFLTSSLDRFGMNKIFFMALFFIKRSRLAIRNPDFFSWFQMVRLSNDRDWHKIESESWMGTVFGSLLYHPKIGLNIPEEHSCIDFFSQSYPSTKLMHGNNSNTLAYRSLRPACD
jgi:hypothetical protein